MEENQSKVSTESYKGVRDFYPEDKFVQDYMFGVMRKTARSFGYSEYDASILEPAELYKTKSGEEIVNEQTYTFTDRGEREVTLRPEMTPTVARMVAARRRELSFPLRWFSIPNLFRYERPQKGRLREHWQLNADIFGVDNSWAETEVIALASELLANFGAKQDDFEIRVSSRKILNDIYKLYGFDKDQSYRISKLIDKKSKISAEEFAVQLREAAGEYAAELETLLSTNGDIEAVKAGEGYRETMEVIERLNGLGVANTSFDVSLMRGFDYYTGIIFEIFDTDPENRRSMFGGGRYDDLLSIFGSEKVPAVGFGMGDVTLRDFLESRNLLPAYAPSAKLYICVVDSASAERAETLAKELRNAGLSAAVDLTGKKLGDQLKKAEKDSVPYALIIGENEVSSGKYKLKTLATREEEELGIREIIEKINQKSKIKDQN
ncbi:MAG TPA: histidine--tRNA ligase [Candidatus Paceibacterota bacterium]|nr:histidine--tRNA ligase [Candidatus Paceibacterota bacterium]